MKRIITINQSAQEKNKIKVASFYPFLCLVDVRYYIGDILEVTWIKAIIGIFLIIANVLWGSYQSLYTGLIVMSILSLGIKSFDKQSNEMIRNLQFFIMDWVWVAILKQVDSVVSVDGIPQGVILNVGVIWLILSELRSIIEVSEKLGFPVPEVLKKLSKKNSIMDHNIVD